MNVEEPNRKSCFDRILGMLGGGLAGMILGAASIVLLNFSLSFFASVAVLIFACVCVALLGLFAPQFTLPHSYFVFAFFSGDEDSDLPVYVLLAALSALGGMLAMALAMLFRIQIVFLFGFLLAIPFLIVAYRTDAKE